MFEDNSNAGPLIQGIIGKAAKEEEEELTKKWLWQP
jgi:hypothetical protein